MPCRHSLISLPFVLCLFDTETDTIFPYSGGLQGTDVPIPLATVTKNKATSKTEFWRIRDSINGMRWATTTDRTIGNFYKPKY